MFLYQFSIYFTVNRKKYQRLENLNSIWFIIKKEYSRNKKQIHVQLEFKLFLYLFVFLINHL